MRKHRLRPGLKFVLWSLGALLTDETSIRLLQETWSSVENCFSNAPPITVIVSSKLLACLLKGFELCCLQTLISSELSLCSFFADVN